MCCFGVLAAVRAQFYEIDGQGGGMQFGVLAQVCSVGSGAGAVFRYLGSMLVFLFLITMGVLDIMVQPWFPSAKKKALCGSTGVPYLTSTH